MYKSVYIIDFILFLKDKRIVIVKMKFVYKIIFG